MNIQGIEVLGEHFEAICLLTKDQWRTLFKSLKNQELTLLESTSDEKQLLGIHYRTKKISEIESLFMQVIDRKPKKP